MGLFSGLVWKATWGFPLAVAILVLLVLFPLAAAAAKVSLTPFIRVYVIVCRLPIASKEQAASSFYANMFIVYGANVKACRACVCLCVCVLAERKT